MIGLEPAELRRCLHIPDERGMVQGVNDLVVFGLVALGSESLGRSVQHPENFCAFVVDDATCLLVAKDRKRPLL